MVYVFLANGFEETEAIAPVDMMRRAKLDDVYTVGIGGSAVTSSHGITVKCDKTDKDVVLDKHLKLIVLPGGVAGTQHLEESETVGKAIDYCVENGIPIGAICAAPSILGKKGLLDGRKVACFPTFQKFLPNSEISSKKVITDGIFTTAAGAGVSVEFGLELVRVLVGDETAQNIFKTIQCRN